MMKEAIDLLDFREELKLKEAMVAEPHEGKSQTSSVSRQVSNRSRISVRKLKSDRLLQMVQHNSAKSSQVDEKAACDIKILDINKMDSCQSVTPISRAIKHFDK